jgi:hypothetical protein
MGSYEASVIDVTERFRLQDWPGSSEAIVISMDHAGNAIMMDRMGRIGLFDHDSGNTERLADNFEEFVGWCLTRG